MFDVISADIASRATASLYSTRERTRVNTNSNHTGMKRMNSVASVQLLGYPGSPSQPSTNSRKVAGSTRLRRRLSRIFHCETREIGFGTFRPVSSQTLGNSEHVICQSPRNQRCLRRL